MEHELIIAFLAEGEASQPNYYDAAIKRTYLLRPASEYMRYIDLLRNEKPVFASINDESPAFTFLYTGQEPVGAGELTE